MDHFRFAASDFSFTNNGSFAGNFAITGNAVQFTLATVPEPSTCILIRIGLLGLLALRRVRGS